MKSKSIWRKYNAVKGLEVSIKGGVRRTYDDVRAWTGKGLPQMMSRQVDANGNLYVEIKKPRRMDLRIDRLVASCYYHTVGKRLQGQVFIIHKDLYSVHFNAGASVRNINIWMRSSCIFSICRFTCILMNPASAGTCKRHN